MFKATIREANHAIKAPTSKPTTRRGLRHHGLLALDAGRVLASDAPALSATAEAHAPSVPVLTLAVQPVVAPLRAPSPEKSSGALLELLFILLRAQDTLLHDLT